MTLLEPVGKQMDRGLVFVLPWLEMLANCPSQGEAIEDGAHEESEAGPFGRLISLNPWNTMTHIQYEEGTANPWPQDLHVYLMRLGFCFFQAWLGLETEPVPCFGSN